MRFPRISVAKHVLAAVLGVCLLAGCDDPGVYSYPEVGCGPEVGTPGVARQTISLNGTWALGQGTLTDIPPVAFDRIVPVPGLVTLANPPYTEVGVESAQRDAFWYRKVFDAPAAHDTTLLCVQRAKYGIKVWLNGQPLGRHDGAFTTAEFDASAAIRANDTNELVIRVGADRTQVSPSVPVGDDAEKRQFIPGLWDDVNLVVTGAQTIVRVKVETDIAMARATVHTTVRNGGPTALEVELAQGAYEWVGDASVSPTLTTNATLAAGESRVLTQVFPITDMRLWSTEDAFLYGLRSELKQAGVVRDDRKTRFGMRKVQWRSAASGSTPGFYLNDAYTYLRGSNMVLQRFFEDPDSALLPWDETWVRALLGEHPKNTFDWNLLRVHLGRAPGFWYDIADEVGILIADEYMAWIPRQNAWSVDEFEGEVRNWVQDSWNHPSIAWWDASNETNAEISTQVIARVRGIDPTRQWENGGYLDPQGPNDPVEDHPYQYLVLLTPNGSFEIGDLDSNDGQPPQAGSTAVAPGHPYINNEYGWLWIDREGAPTVLTEDVWLEVLGGTGFAPEIYREAYAYLTAGLTGFWRSHRGYAGVQHFPYLGYFRRDTGWTCDNFLDLSTLTLEPRWQAYGADAFQRMSVYIDSWQDDYPRGQTANIPLKVINDSGSPEVAMLDLLAVRPDGSIAAMSTTAPLMLEPLGAVDQTLSIRIPDLPELVLFARLRPANAERRTVYDRRKIGYPNPGAAIPDPPGSLFADGFEGGDVSGWSSTGR